MWHDVWYEKFNVHSKTDRITSIVSYYGRELYRVAVAVCVVCVLAYSFMWQMCSYTPTTLPRSDPEQRVSVMAAKLSASFILETLIHSKEKVCWKISDNCLY